MRISTRDTLLHTSLHVYSCPACCEASLSGLLLFGLCCPIRLLYIYIDMYRDRMWVGLGMQWHVLDSSHHGINESVYSRQAVQD
jgi:hypothetical protein